MKTIFVYLVDLCILLYQVFILTQPIFGQIMLFILYREITLEKSYKIELVYVTRDIISQLHC